MRRRKTRRAARSDCRARSARRPERHSPETTSRASRRRSRRSSTGRTGVDGRGDHLRRRRRCRAATVRGDSRRDLDREDERQGNRRHPREPRDCRCVPFPAARATDPRSNSTGEPAAAQPAQRRRTERRVRDPAERRLPAVLLELRRRRRSTGSIATLLFTNEEARDIVLRQADAWHGPNSARTGRRRPVERARRRAGWRRRRVRRQERSIQVHLRDGAAQPRELRSRFRATATRSCSRVTTRSTHPPSQLYLYKATSGRAHVWNDEGTLYAFVADTAAINDYGDITEADAPG